MERTLTGELRSRVGERVRLAGWLHHQRRLARLTFVLVRDRAGLAQVVVEDPALIEAVAGWLPETVLEVEATVAASEQAPRGVELREPAFTVLSEPAEQPPIELRRPELKEQLPTILDHAAVALRHPRRRAAFEIAAASVRGYRAALDRLGFVEIQTPKIVASATEGGSNVFRVDYFGREAFLAQSPQFSDPGYARPETAGFKPFQSSGITLDSVRWVELSTPRSRRSSASASSRKTTPARCR